MVGKILLIVLAVGVVILLLPLLRKQKRYLFIGPDLAELQYTEVFFNNGDLKLAGMLFLPPGEGAFPRGEGPFPAAVVIHGSGTSQRDSPWYLTVTKHLQENGIAVLLPDKRGSEKSEGNWKEASFIELAKDTRSAVNFLREQTIFKCDRIGVIGFSQGGWIAPIVATEDEKLAFVVSMSGPGVTTEEQVEWEETSRLANYTYPFLARPLALLIARNFIQKEKFWRAIGGFNPLPHWQKVTNPSFMAFGENDKNLPVEESVKRIQALGQSNIMVKVYPQGGHAIFDRATGRVQEAYLQDLVDFIGTTQKEP